MARTVLSTLPGVAPCERLEVALQQSGDGSLTIELNEQHYAEGIGWFTQRSLRLEPSQWRQLQGVLGGVSASRSIAAAVERTPATLAFPAPQSARPMRQAVGDGPR